MNPIFDELKELYCKNPLVDCMNNIIYDGIISEHNYNKQERKILFIAKEHNRLNDSYDSGSYQNWWAPENKADNNIRYTFSHRLSEWSYGLLNDFPDYSLIQPTDKQNALKAIAFINVKKTYGGASSNPDVLKNYIQTSQTLLQKQIREIAPNIIVTCFRYDDLTKELFGFDSMLPIPNSSFSYQKWNETLVINFYHPSARKKKCSLYSQLKEIVEIAKSSV
ncbi:hypothetical protein [Spirosoma montaniterrae]|nr:hypothetical protein [Spirosoma montaniterrae]